MGRFKVNFNRTRVYYNDDDWKFEDEGEVPEEFIFDDQAEESYVCAFSTPSDDVEKGRSTEKANILSPKEKSTLPKTSTRQLSQEASTLDRKMYSLKKSIKYPNAWDQETTCGKCRFKVHLVMDHIIIRLFTLFLVIFDIVVMLLSIYAKTQKEKNMYAAITLGVVSYFVLEAIMRIFAWGKEFFHHRLEVIDLSVILITFVFTVTVEALKYYQKLKYANLIVIFRLLRVVLYLRIFYGVWQSVRVAARNLIGQNKRRYVKDGYDLDLTYITERVIAMSFPSSGLIASYRNPIKAVAQFFNEKHRDHYMIYNLCSERHYDTSHFHDRVKRLKIDDHNVPKMSELLQFCQEADEFTKADHKNVLAIHCKGGKGRTGTCVAGYLLFTGQIKTADKALQYFGLRRTDTAKGIEFQGVETPSQIRYVQYLERILKNFEGKMPVERELMVKSLKITGLKTVGNGDGSDLTMQIVQDGKVINECPVQGQYRANKDMLLNKFLYDSSNKISGDVKFRFLSTNKDVPMDYDDCAFFFWIHTSFITNDKFYARGKEIGNSHKPKYRNIYGEDFSVTLTFIEPLEEIVVTV